MSQPTAHTGSSRKTVTTGRDGMCLQVHVACAWCMQCGWAPHSCHLCMQRTTLPHLQHLQILCWCSLLPATHFTGAGGSKWWSRSERARHQQPAAHPPALLGGPCTKRPGRVQGGVPAGRALPVGRLKGQQSLLAIRGHDWCELVVCWLCPPVSEDMRVIGISKTKCCL